MRASKRSQLTVKDFMRTSLLKLDASSTVLDAARLMKQNDAGSVLVTVNGEHVGIVTERDILYKIAAEDLPASSVPLRSVMSTDDLLDRLGHTDNGGAEADGEAPHQEAPGHRWGQADRDGQPEVYSGRKLQADEGFQAKPKISLRPWRIQRGR